MIQLHTIVFFFSSRRRHTRWNCDWSSDVCSSDLAEERFRRLGLTNIETRLGDGAPGWIEEQPFDGIIVAAAAPRIPAPLADQLAPGGRLVIPVGDLASQELVILQRPASGEGEDLRQR